MLEAHFLLPPALAQPVPLLPFVYHTSRRQILNLRLKVYKESEKIKKPLVHKEADLFYRYQQIRKAYVFGWILGLGTYKNIIFS